MNEEKKEKPMVGKQVVCSLCGKGHGTLKKVGPNTYSHLASPCPPEPKKEED